MASVIDVLQTIIDVETICTPDRPRAARNTLPSECNVNLVMLHSMGRQSIRVGGTNVRFPLVFFRSTPDSRRRGEDRLSP